MNPKRNNSQANSQENALSKRASETSKGSKKSQGGQMSDVFGQSAAKLNTAHLPIGRGSTANFEGELFASISNPDTIVSNSTSNSKLPTTIDCRKKYIDQLDNDVSANTTISYREISCVQSTTEVTFIKHEISAQEQVTEKSPANTQEDDSDWREPEQYVTELEKYGSHNLGATSSAVGFLNTDSNNHVNETVDLTDDYPFQKGKENMCFDETSSVEVTGGEAFEDDYFHDSLDFFELEDQGQLVTDKYACNDDDNDVFYNAEDSSYCRFMEKVIENNNRPFDEELEFLMPTGVQNPPSESSSTSSNAKRKRDGNDECSESNVAKNIKTEHIQLSSQAPSFGSDADMPLLNDLAMPCPKFDFGCQFNSLLPCSPPCAKDVGPLLLPDSQSIFGDQDAEYITGTGTGFSLFSEGETIHDQTPDYPLPSFQANIQAPLNKWKTEESKLAAISLKPIDSTPEFRQARPVVSDNGKLLFWWYDGYEHQDQSFIYLFGKIYNSSQDNYVSCCLLVQNIERELYFLPRTHKLDDKGEVSSDIVAIEDVYAEIEGMFKERGIKDYTMERCQRKYAFELPGMPFETSYVMLHYSFLDDELPTSLTGKTFSRVFGTNTGLLEHFIIKNNIMGPCWLELNNFEIVDLKQPWCRVNIKIDSPEDCSVVVDTQSDSQTNTPPLNILSLNLVTETNCETNINEVVAASIFVSQDVELEQQHSVSTVKGTRYTFVRPLAGTGFPSYIKRMLPKEMKSNKHSIVTEVSESSLLYNLIAKIDAIDPDIIVGHDFLNVTLDILLHRMKDLEVLNWNKLGRLGTSIWPILQFGPGGTGVCTYEERLFMSGRLICDTLIASKDLISSTSYSFSDLVSSNLNIAHEDIKTCTLKSFFDRAAGIVEVAKRCCFDAFLTYALMVKLQILPLTKQLTNLSGNLWSRSMLGARSERNDYLLLHSFYMQNFICPDKRGIKGKRKKEDVDEDQDFEMPSNKKQKGANGSCRVSFYGDKVLEPKPGFYDKYVLLLRFDNLYLSIMQEHNVCFTTMSIQANTCEESQGFSNNQRSSGLLPSLVKGFLQQRQYLKRLMKNPLLSESTKSQYNTEQLALKLTADNVYECLGSSISRFFAKSLATFIASKCRDIVQATVKLAKDCGLEVIYGDTDALMINTNQARIAKVKAIAEEFKKNMDGCYQLFETGTDRFLRHTLLLTEKKFAALCVSEKPDGVGYQESIEVEDFEMVRRDWCNLSHKSSEQVLRLILSDNNREDVVNEIHAYLKYVAMQLRDSHYPIEDFIVQKQLARSPGLYDSERSNPQVIVAKEMQRVGIEIKAGDTIPYIVCKSEELDTSSTVAFNTPRMPDDVKTGKAKIDLEWYINKQILPPIARLCDHIDGTNLNELTSCLSLF